MPNDLTVTESTNAKFVCRSNVLTSKISWLKDGKVINNDRRYNIYSNGDIEIRRVLVEDEGFYVCSISNSENIKYAQAKLTVNIPVTFIKRPIDVSSVEGDSAEFYCKVSGKPEPKIIWKKDGFIIKKTSNQTSKLSEYEFYQNDEILRVNNLNRGNHEGVYSCWAGNSVNKISSDARLFINPPERPFFKITQQNISVFENQQTTLECFAEGKPKPQVLWYKDGQRISTDSRVYFDSFGYLTFNQVRVTDAGDYICQAENIAGSSTHKFKLSVKDIYGTIISNTILTDAVEKARKEVNKQFQQSISRLNDRRRPKTHSELMALIRFPKESTLHLASSEEIYERALDIIFRYANNITFNLTRKNFETQDVLTHSQLRQISDLSGCFRYKRKVNCSQRCLNYRSFDGTCNNLNNPRWGAANTALKRLLPAEYENGFSTPKGWNKSHLYHGYMLPNARDVTTKLLTTDKITDDQKFSLMLMQWGQFLDHDLGHTVMAMSLNRFSNGIACRDSCTNEQPCFPIEVLPNDTRRTHVPGQCMEFVRSSAVCGSGETSLLGNKIHQREQLNQLTAFIDASNVYGSSDQDGFDIRERTVNTGKLKVHSTPKYPKGFLPFNLDTPMDCQRDNTTTVGCFMAGDYRANEQLGLLAMHNLWVRHHNYMVDRLKKVNPHWLPEQLFQETRKIISAQMQFITFEQWLPYVFGPSGMKILGKYKGYDPHVEPIITNEFATAAFRFGHTLIQPFTFRFNETFQPIPEGNLLLRDSFFAPQRYYYEGGMDPILRGLFGSPAKLKLPRETMNSELTERLFHITRAISQDLAALNIQRGRDHGIPGYAAFRKLCNLTEAKSFDDLKKEISNKEVRDILQKLYGDVRNIDLFPGGILEDVVPGAKMGPTFMCIISHQMKVLRDGDRFWYENPSQFTPAQLREIKKTSFAKIICENGDNMPYIQRDVFLNAKFPNDMLECSQIDDISLEPWKNCCENNPEGLCGEPAYFYVPIESSRYKRHYGKN
ncbi:unnamed protein product [Brachionus calyciflorus]|uniref:Ig-like domain-containing protein n=1 Tax=Brachionus calyciflorus TaxID=104777 RepID=A0A814AWJ5_9BILA|nr:unnamed protein product [Brachionus calyciflorus]